MEEKDNTIKKGLNDIISSFNFNENNKNNNLEKSPESYESCKLSTKLIKDLNNFKDIQKDKELEIKVGNYLIKKTLGKGTFGKVKLAIYLPRNKKVAIKILEKKRIKEEDDIVRLKREFEMLSQFNHPNVITVSEIFESNEAYFTVMEYCEGGELFNYIVENKYLSEEKSAFFYYQLISGLEYIHSLGIVHRDLKPENLLLTHEHILKIIDFGLSNYFKNSQVQLLETPCGSPCYASPEMLSGNNYDGFKIDIWATGIILFAMLCGFLPFDDKDNNVLFKKILDCKVNFPNYLSEEAKDLLKKILVTNPKKRINIQEIKKHPFYLKGKKIFETNFTIYQVTADDIVDSEDSSYFYDFKYMNESYFINNLLYYDSARKSEVVLNKLKLNELFLCGSSKKRSSSYALFNLKNTNELVYEDKNKNKILKKLINLEKKLKKLNKNKQKEKKTNEKEENNISNLFKEKDKLILGKHKNEGLNYNHSITFHIKDINSFVENLIIEYKIEEELNKFEKNKKNSTIEKSDNHKKINKHTKSKTKSEDNKDKKNKFQRKIKNFNRVKKIKNVSNEKEKNNNSSNRFSFFKNKKEEAIKKNNEYNDFMKTQPNKNLFNKKAIINQNKKPNTNKVNIKKKESAKINKLFINNNKIIKINKLPRLPQSIKLKKPRRKIRSTSNNSKRKNFKNILNRIKAQSIKTSINLINKPNIIHHHVTNITNMTQKNYFSNVIINNFKGKEEHKLNSTYKNKSKNLFDMPAFKIDKILNLKSNINQVKKQPNKNWKLKSSLQKIIFKEDNILKNSMKLNPINSIDEEGKSQNKSNIKRMQSKKKSKDKEIESRTIPANTKKNKQYKIKVSFINNNNNNNNKLNKKKIYLNTENSIRNSSINKEKFLDKKEYNTKNVFNEKKYKIFLTDINFEDEIMSRSKLNYINSTENSCSNRSYNKNIINSFDKKKKNNNNTITNRNKNKIGVKKIERKKNTFKNILKFKKFPVLNIKNIIGNSNIIKIESNSMKYQKQINSQRNKPNVINSNRKYIGTYHYINSARINDKKILNTSYNIGNSHYIGNLTENTPFYNNISKLCKFKTSQNNIRNKIILNNNYNHLNKNFFVNITNDNIKMNSSKNKSLLNYNNDINSLLLNKNINSNKNKMNKNIYLDKFLVSKKLLASLRKRSNLKSMLINNFFDKRLGSKTQKNSLKINKLNENKNKINNNSAIINFPNNVKQIKFNNNNNIDNSKKASKNNFFKKNELIRFKTELYSSLRGEKKKHKKIKSMKDSINVKQKNISKKMSNNFKYLNSDNNTNNNSLGVNFLNNEMNSNTFNYSNININSIDNFFKFTK